MGKNLDEKLLDQIDIISGDLREALENQDDEKAKRHAKKLKEKIKAIKDCETYSVFTHDFSYSAQVSIKRFEIEEFRESIIYKGRGEILNELMEAIIDKAIELEEKYESEFSNEHLQYLVGRFINRITNYNLWTILNKKEKEEFPLKPKCFEKKQKELENLVKKYYKNKKSKPWEGVEDTCKLYISFIKSKTPKEFLKRIIDNRIDVAKDEFARLGCRGKVGDYVEEELGTLEKVAKIIKETGSISQEEIEKYISDIHKKDPIYREYLGESTIPTSEISKEIEEGIYVDVEGTLLIDGKLNMGLVKYLKKEMKNGKKIVVYTGGNTKKLTEKLQNYKIFPKELLPVQPKSNYRGKTLETVIDDDNPSKEGIQYLNIKKPDEF